MEQQIIPPQIIEFDILVIPEPWRRARVQRVGRGVRHFTDQNTRAYKAIVSQLAKANMVGKRLMTDAVTATLAFHMPIPARWSRRKAEAARLGLTRPIVTPDSDNLAKAILDACNEVVFRDDAQVVYLLATKHYADTPRVAVRFEEWRP